MKTLVSLLLCFTFSLAQSQTEEELVLDVTAENLYVPWDMSWGKDNHIWVLQKDGQLTRINPDTKEQEDILQIPNVFQSNDNSGAHAMALHPNFPMTPWVYCYYTFSEFRGRLVKIQIPLSEESTAISVETLLDTIPGNSSHNGSRLVWGPDDFLYFCTGDAYMSDWAQQTNNFAGKILRMDENGQPAPNNPFGGYLYSIGHRNPQGLVFADNGKLYSSEHGTSTDDELNLIEAGGNYGWPLVSGYCDTPSEIADCDGQGFIEPLTTWTPTDAPSGIAYFDYPSIPDWQNSLLVCFLKRQCLRVLKLNSDGTQVVDETIIFDEALGRLREVLVAPNGRVFIATSNREINGWDFLAESNDDRIIEVINPAYAYPVLDPLLENMLGAEDPYHLFPNPTRLFLNVSFKHDAELLAYQILDLGGQVLQENQIEPRIDGICSIPLEGLPAGTYTIRLMTEGVPDFSQQFIIAID